MPDVRAFCFGRCGRCSNTSPITVQHLYYPSLMQRLAIGLRVTDIRGRRAGQVTNLLKCCFEVKGDGPKLNIVQDGIYNVTDTTAELICDLSEVGRYACKIHGSKPGPAAAGW